MGFCDTGLSDEGKEGAPELGLGEGFCVDGNGANVAPVLVGAAVVVGFAEGLMVGALVGGAAALLRRRMGRAMGACDLSCRNSFLPPTGSPHG